MKQGWEIKRLGEIIIVERGSSPRPIDKYITTNKDGVNWIKIGDTKNIDKYIFSAKEKITKEGALKSRYVKNGDFILSNSMSLGKPYIMKTDGYIHDGWFVLRLPNVIDAEYFYYILSSPNAQKQFTNLSAGAIVKNISSDLVKKTIIPIPPLPEQHRIVNILDTAFAKIDELKATAEQNLQNARDLFQASLRKALTPREGWKKFRLEDITKKIGSGATPKGGKESYKTDGIALIRSMNVHNIRFEYKDLAFIDDFQAKQLDNVIVQEDDVLFNITGASVTRTCVVPKEVIPARVNQHVSIIRPITSLVGPYFLCYMLMGYYNVILDELANAGGSTRQAITKAQLEKFEIEIPTLSEQQQITEKLDALSERCKALEENYRQTVALTQDLKQALLKKAFSGEL